MEHEIDHTPSALLTHLSLAGRTFAALLRRRTGQLSAAPDLDLDVNLAVLDRDSAEGAYFTGFTFATAPRLPFLCVVLDGHRSRVVEMSTDQLAPFMALSGLDGAARIRCPQEALTGGWTTPRGSALQNLTVQYQLEISRLLIGAARLAAQSTEHFLLGRRSAEGALLDVQDVRFKLAEVLARIECLEAAAAQVLLITDPFPIRDMAAAVFATAATWLREIVDVCVQLHGGKGYMTTSLVAQLFCQAGIIHRTITPTASIWLSHSTGGIDSGTPTGLGSDAFRIDFKTFLAREASPRLPDWWNEDGVPRDLFRAFGREGYLGQAAAPEWGGCGATGFARNMELTEAMVEADQFALAVSTMLIANSVVPVLSRYGSDSLKADYLPAIIAGERIASLAITEGGSAGAMIATLETRATDQGDHWILNGQKHYITNAPAADVALVLARTGHTGAAQDLTLFLVPMRSDGVEVVEKYRKLGAHASETGRIVLNDCKIPKENVVGHIGSGQICVISAITEERLLIAVAALAFSLRCLDRALVSAREPAGRRLLGSQRAQALVLRMRCMAAAAEVIAGRTPMIDAVMLKFVCGDFVKATVETCETVLLHEIEPGANDDWLERARRDARVMSIFTGASDVMRDHYSRRIVAGVRLRASRSAKASETSVSEVAVA